MDPKPPLPSWCCKRTRTTRVLIASPSQSTPEKDHQESSILSTEEERGQRSPLSATSTASTVVDPHNHHMSDDIKNHQIDNSPHRHVCTICGKSFGTHQALGGHKSIHRVIRSPAQPRQRFGGGMSHSCRTCGAIFGTGHQLGGHMRKHYDPLKRTRKGDIIATIVDDQQGQKVSDFNNWGSICEAVPMVSEGGAYVSSQGGGDVDQKPAVTEEIDLELRLWFK